LAGFDATDGGLQRYLPWPSERCVVIDDSVATDEAPLLEVLGIAVHAIDLADVERGARVGVFGTGPVGLVLIRALAAAGADVIVATDGLSHRAAAARASGAREALISDSDSENDSGSMASLAQFELDVSFECAGEDAA